MKRAKSCLFLVLISVILVFIAYVFAAGCLGSVIGHADLTPTDDKSVQVSHIFPPMYNYPKDVPGIPGDDSAGKFLPGDILQPKEGSPVFDPDLAIIITGDTGDGYYTIDGVSRSGSTWTRIPDSVAGTISHQEIEQLFPDRIGHIDGAALPAVQGQAEAQVMDKRPME